MNILVCFTVEPDFDRFSGQDWSSLHQAEDLDFTRRRKIWNCFDESALEWSLRLKDTCNALELPVSLTALTVSEEEHIPFLKTLCALPFDRVMRVPCGPGFDCGHTAALLAGCIRSAGPFDLVLTGQRSASGYSAAVPLLLAETLGLPFYGNVSEANMVSDSTVRLCRQVSGGVLEQTVKLPLVASVGNSSVSYLRVPTLRQRMASGSKEPEIRSPSLTTAAMPNMEPLALRQEQTQRRCRMIPGENAAEQAHTLYYKYLRRLAE